MSTNHRVHPILARVTAVVLALAFVLQSATIAGQGCLSRAFRGSCCCAVFSEAEAIDAGPAPVASIQTPARHSCCAPAASERTPDPAGPRFEPKDSCSCALAPLPTAPAAPQGPAASFERAPEQGGFEHWIGQFAVLAPSCPIGHDPPIAVRPPGLPPRSAATFARQRLAQRGVLGLLSDLCTFRS